MGDIKGDARSLDYSSGNAQTWVAESDPGTPSNMQWKKVIWDSHKMRPFLRERDKGACDSTNRSPSFTP